LRDYALQADPVVAVEFAASEFSSNPGLANYEDFSESHI